MASLWPAEDARWRLIDRAFLLMTGALFFWCVLVWRAVIGDGMAWRPLSMVLLSGGMLLQAAASMVRRHSQWLFYVAIGGSLSLIVASTGVAR